MTDGDCVSADFCLLRWRGVLAQHSYFSRFILCAYVRPKTAFICFLLYDAIIESASLRAHGSQVWNPNAAGTSRKKTRPLNRSRMNRFALDQLFRLESVSVWILSIWRQELRGAEGQLESMAAGNT